MLGSTVGATFYISKQIKQKTEAVRTYYARDTQNKNAELGSRLKKDEQKLFEQERAIKSVFLPETDLVSFIKYIEAKGEEFNLKISIEKVDKGEFENIGDSYKVQPISFYVSIEGTFEQIKNFIDTLLGGQKILQLKELKMYKTSEGGAQDTYTGRIIITGNILSII